LAPPCHLVGRVLREDNPHAKQRDAKHRKQKPGPPRASRHPHIDLTAKNGRAQRDNGVRLIS